MEDWTCISHPLDEKINYYECSGCGRPVIALTADKADEAYPSIVNYHFCPYCGKEIRYEKIERRVPRSYHDVNYIYPEDRQFFNVKKTWYWTKAIPTDFIEEKTKEGYSKAEIVNMYMNKLSGMSLEELGLPETRSESVGLAN